jgi:hypothetical protein
MEMKTQVTNYGRTLRWTAIVLGFCSVFTVLVFFSLPWLLIRPPETTPSDVIFYSGSGDSEETNQYVVALYNQGLAKKIVCSSGQIAWNTYPADFVREQLLQLGIPAEDVKTFHTPRVDCGADLVPMFLNLCKEQGWQRVLIVANPIASRATQRVLGNRFEQARIQLAITYAPSDREKLSGQWWRQHKQTQMVVQQGIETFVDLFYPHCR